MYNLVDANRIKTKKTSKASLFPIFEINIYKNTK